MANQGAALPGIVATSAFVHGQLKLRYVEGSLPIIVGFNTDIPIGSVRGTGPPSADAIFNIAGTWTDSINGAAGVGVTMQPGESATYPLWIDFTDARSNAAATFSKSTLDDMTFALLPTVDQVGTDAVTTVSGPRAAYCNGNDHELLPFAKLPWSYSGGVSDVSCSAGSGRRFGS